MTDTATLDQAAYSAQPVYYADPTVVEEQRLAQAYDEATSLLQAATPSGTVLDTSVYELAQQVSGNNVNANGDAAAQYLASNTDLPVASAFNYDNDKCSAYFLGEYAQACANLNVYLTGEARRQVQIGALTSQDFTNGVDIRLRKFSEIIYLGRRNQLGAVVNPNGWAATNNQGGGNIILGTSSTQIVTPSTSGFGIAPVIIVVLGIVAILAVAGLIVMVTRAATAEKDRQTAFSICQQAMSSNNPNAASICQDMTKVINTSQQSEAASGILSSIFGTDAVNSVVKYAAIGVGALILIQFGPQIISSLSRMKDSLQEPKMNNLRALKNYYRL